MRLVSCVLAAGLLLGASACGGSSEKTAQQPSSPFAYDRSSSLNFADHGRANSAYPIAVRDVSYQSGRDRVSAYLVLPQHPRGRLPAAIYLHGSGGDRTQFVAQAAWLAGRGAIALVLTAPSSTQQAAASTPLDELRREVKLTERDVVAVRRGVDLLSKRDDVDPKRIGFVGWSAGARTGAVLAGVEPRFRALVLMSGGASPVASYAAAAPQNLRRSITRSLTPVDPLRYVGRSHAALLLQDGRRDSIVPRAALEGIVHAAPTGTDVRWYQAQHGLNVRAYRDQLAWLTQKLRITGPPVTGAATGP